MDYYIKIWEQHPPAHVVIQSDEHQPDTHVLVDYSRAHPPVRVRATAQYHYPTGIPRAQQDLREDNPYYAKQNLTTLWIMFALAFGGQHATPVPGSTFYMTNVYNLLERTIIAERRQKMMEMNKEKTKKKQQEVSLPMTL